MLDLPILTDLVSLAQLTSPLVLPLPMEPPVELDSTYPLHGPTVLLVQSELLPVLLPLMHYLVSQDTMLPQSVDLKLPVPHVQLPETSSLVTELTMLSVVNQDSMLLMDNVLLAQVMLYHVMEELFSNVTLDSS